MQPTSDTPSPGPNYDFIFKEPQQQPKSRFGLPNMPKPALIGVGVIVFLIIITVVGILARGGPGNTELLYGSVGQAQEISRVSTLVETDSKDPDMQSLAATTKVVMASSQSQLTDYLNRAGVKVDPKVLLQYQDKQIDNELKKSMLENKLEQTYASYLKTALEKYLSNLKQAYPSLGDNGKSLVSEVFDSGSTLLKAPQLTAADGS